MKDKGIQAFIPLSGCLHFFLKDKFCEVFILLCELESFVFPINSHI